MLLYLTEFPYPIVSIWSAEQMGQHKQLSNNLLKIIIIIQFPRSERHSTRLRSDWLWQDLLHGKHIQPE